MIHPEFPTSGTAKAGSVQSNSCHEAAKPAVRFKSLTFSDGTTVEMEPNDVVVLVGPNNAGKSLALRELEAYVGGTPDTKVVVLANTDKVGDPDSFEEFVRDNTRVESSNQGQNLNIQGFGISLGMGGSDLASMWPRGIGQFRSLFCRSIGTENRINDSDPPAAIDIFHESPSHPIHLLYDDRVENRISAYFRQAFGLDLILYRAGGRTSHLLVGERLKPKCGEDRISATYCKRLMDSTEELRTQGDGMRSFASVILHLLAPLTPSVLLLDEPEAFLHPPQARVLGSVIGNERSERAQLFVATHSPDVLEGLVNVAAGHLKVLRMQRDDNVNRVKILDKERVQEISLDPFMKYSSVLSGVFHERVVVCEGDSDCMFYNSLLAIPQVHGDFYPDVLFIHSGGKHKMPNLGKALVSLGVPADLIVDMDVLNDLGLFRRIVESLEGDWTQFELSAKAVNTAIEQQRSSLAVNDLKVEIRKILDQAQNTTTNLDSLKVDIQAQFNKASPWDAIKSSGELALPAGQATIHYRTLQSLCRDIGLWIVPVGKLEGFCKLVGGHGPSWVQVVMEQFDLETAPELEEAREFVHQIWATKQN